MHPDKRPNADHSPEALARKLRALPLPPVPAGLEARLLASIPAGKPVSRRRRFLLAGVAGGLAAACLAVVAFWQAGDGKNALTPGESKSAQQVEPQLPLDSPGIPAWWEARRVLDEADIPAFTWPLDETPPITVHTALRSLRI